MAKERARARRATTVHPEEGSTEAGLDAEPTAGASTVRCAGFGFGLDLDLDFDDDGVALSDAAEPGERADPAAFRAAFATWAAFFVALRARFLAFSFASRASFFAAFFAFATSASLLFCARLAFRACSFSSAFCFFFFFRAFLSDFLSFFDATNLSPLRSLDDRVWPILCPVPAQR
ncbi:MAG: hypothetical protein JWP19_696 [Rhodoglobus sp.]|nr:hypothetical protein [Rhodoglobus sp.]